MDCQAHIAIQIHLRFQYTKCPDLVGGAAYHQLLIKRHGRHTAMWMFEYIHSHTSKNPTAGGVWTSEFLLSPWHAMWVCAWVWFGEWQIQFVLEVDNGVEVPADLPIISVLKERFNQGPVKLIVSFVSDYANLKLDN